MLNPPQYADVYNDSPTKVSTSTPRQKFGIPAKSLMKWRFGDDFVKSGFFSPKVCCDSLPKVVFPADGNSPPTVGKEEGLGLQSAPECFQSALIASSERRQNGPERPRAS